MKSHSLSVVVLSFLSVLVSGQDMFDVLNQNGLTSFASDLQRDTALIAKVNQRNDITIYAPTNLAMATAPNSGNHKLRKRANEASNSYHISHFGPPPYPMTKRHNSAIRESGLLTLATFLEDPAHVNLGQGQPGRAVQSGQEGSIEISSGMGAIARQVAGPFPFDGGNIYAVDGVFALPEPLFESLHAVGLTGFCDAINTAGLGNKLSETPGVTIFAFESASSDTAATTVAEHTISTGFEFTPDLLNKRSFRSDAGTKLEITRQGGTTFVNGVRIIRSDIVIKNGVVHQLERALPH